MEGQGNWYFEETRIKERSAELVHSERTSLHAARLRRARDTDSAARQPAALDQDLRRLLGAADRSELPRRTMNTWQRVGFWMLRLVGGTP